MPSGDVDAIFRLLSIALIDLALSGDNAIVIGMAAASLPRRRRGWAILAGAGIAIALRIALTSIASLLMKIPLIAVAGGGILFWVAWRLLDLDTGNTAGAEGPGSGVRAEAPDTLRQAVLLIVTADVTMSIDNVIAVAGAAGGSTELLAIGLLLSMPLLMTTGGAISLLVDRFRWLMYLGAGAICLTGARMILEDPLVATRLALGPAEVLGIGVAVGVALPVAFARARGIRQPSPAPASRGLSERT